MRMDKLLRNKEMPYRICFLLLLIWGLCMSFLIPPWQTPDEKKHLELMGESLCNPELAELLNDDLDLDVNRIAQHGDEKIDMEKWKTALTKSPSYDRGDGLLGGVRPGIVRYLPAAAGIQLGILLQLPTYWVLQLGELFSLIFFLAVAWKAFWLMPCKRGLLLLIMALPMTMQQVSSINYDAVVFPACFLFLALVFHYRNREKKLGLKELLLLSVLLVLIAYVKLPYVFLGVLLVIIPADQFYIAVGPCVVDGRVIRKWRLKACLVLVLLGIAALCLMRGNPFVTLILGMAAEWRQSVHLLINTVGSYGGFLLTSMVGNFGWLDTAMPSVFVGVYYIMLVFASMTPEEEPVCRMNGRTRVILPVLWLVLALLTAAAMVDHTIRTTLFGSEWSAGSYQIREAIYKIPFIGGLQGRYFIPFLALLLLPLPCPEKIRVKGKSVILMVFLLVTMLYCSGILLQRYWL